MENENPDKSLKAAFTSMAYNADSFLKARFDFHSSQADVSIETYRCRILHKLGEIVSRRKIIYLDQKYWICLRDAYLGRKNGLEYQGLLEFLSANVSRGLFICPVSSWIFEELLKQEDKNTRLATARLIDALSLGVSYMPHQEIVSQELIHFIRKNLPHFKNNVSWPIRECIWTRSSSLFGDRIIHWPEINQHQQLKVQKVIEDVQFFTPLEELVEAFEQCEASSIKPIYDVSKINSKKKAVRSQHSNFKSVFLAELEHTYKENEQHIIDVILYLYSLETGNSEKVDLKNISEDMKSRMMAVVMTAFKMGKITNELPSYHIPALLYAYSTWDTNRIVKENDIFDFFHAQVGIPYSDFFLTEDSLKSVACNNLLMLDRIYGTEIISKPDKALERLSLASNQLTNTVLDGTSIKEQLFSHFSCKPTNSSSRNT